ncbi:acyl-CoA dehydrogenase family protein [Kyrpidia tusciae]|uniref:Acyl-CoA dehydrogenase domain protein n=1 Tax=Kyrpidia tusciae (strain DSM 2912 / NBRC 15312 / T2) TaxID=562970 RepID=D5WWU4_KYRT2|nr:acyl-CoA dehydrogenase family protein [Kyrpidia tusciae]ADG05795.1 acyl-CoA dehydrogenase domain protein [Kyrpidia tusciae DSM 2912]
MEEQKKVKGGEFLVGPVDPASVFTPEDFTEEHRMIAKTTYDFCVGEVQPRDAEIEAQNFDVTVGLLKKAGELGLLGADVPEEYGGLGLDKISSTLITEYVTYGGAFALSHGAHVGIGTLPIVYFGNKAQKEKYLPKLASGEWLSAYALTEPTSGSDALGAKTTAVLNAEGTHYILNGTKQFITNAGFADLFIVYAKVDGEKFTAFIVERGFPGVSTGPEEKKMGIKGSSTRQLILEDVPVPVENVLGQIGKGHLIAFNILNIGRYKLAAGCVGSSKIALAMSAKYAKERSQFGKPIAEFPLIQNKLATMAVRTFAAESVIYRTVGLFDRQLQDFDLTQDEVGMQAAAAIGEYALECSINKVFGSEVLDAVADENVQIHGGYGFIAEYGAERIYRDSRINRIFEGTNEINRMLIPGMLMRKVMKGELPLLQKAQQLQGELMSGTVTGVEDGGFLGVERGLIEQAKKIFLLAAGTAVQKYQTKLEEEQEVLAGLADLVIDIFAMESAVLRAVKFAQAHGEEKAGLMADMARCQVYEGFDHLETTARSVLAAVEEGQTLAMVLAGLRKLARRTPVNIAALKRRIAARILDAEKYVVQ